MDTFEMLNVAKKDGRVYEAIDYGIKYRFSTDDGLRVESDFNWKDASETTVYEFLDMEDWEVVDHIEQITKEELELMIGKKIGKIVTSDSKSTQGFHYMYELPKDFGNVILLLKFPSPSHSIIPIIGYNSRTNWEYWDERRREWFNIKDYSKKENVDGEVTFLGWQELLI